MPELEGILNLKRLEDFINEAENKQDQKRYHAPRPLPEVILMELRERATMICSEDFPFKVGDLITPRKGSLLAQIGDLHLVVEINPSAMPNFNLGEYGNPIFGKRMNIRVMGLARDNQSYLCWWGEAFEFEFYNKPTT